MYKTSTLKQMRKENGFTISDMADRLLITPSYYWGLENQRRRLFYDMAIKISSIFNTKPDRIFFTEQK